jgi:uncharacterized membrane protein YdfJ with MMPL/SSD domain
MLIVLAAATIAADFHCLWRMRYATLRWVDVGAFTGLVCALLATLTVLP